jgi:hypothetical protein
MGPDPFKAILGRFRGSRPFSVSCNFQQDLSCHKWQAMIKSFCQPNEAPSSAASKENAMQKNLNAAQHTPGPMIAAAPETAAERDRLFEKCKTFSASQKKLIAENYRLKDALTESRTKAQEQARMAVEAHDEAGRLKALNADLLEALREAEEKIKALAVMARLVSDPKALIKARAAIAKAEGRG